MAAVSDAEGGVTALTYPSFVVGDRRIGGGAPCYVIAEAGSNHDRNLDQALRLIDIAAKAGADAVKFQTFTAPKIAARTSHPISRIEFGGATTLYDLYRSVEMPIEWLATLRDHAREQGIAFLSTPFDPDAADALDELGIPLFKIASFELVDLPLLQHVASKGKPIILSTGMATVGEVEEAISAIRAVADVPIALLHCAINYPAPFTSVNLAAMNTLASAFGCPVGYSDHTTGVTVPVAAVARGAAVIEKHFTTDKTLPGPDHAFALNPDELERMVTSIREAEAAIGSATKGPAPDELVHRDRGRRSLFAVQKIAAGTTITRQMIAVLRPGIGLAPKYLDLVIGRTARHDIPESEPITWENV